MNDFGTNQLECGLYFPCSSAALLSQESLHQPPLRKSSSAIDWNGVVIEAARNNSRQLDWQTALLENNSKSSFSNLQPYLQSQHGGLVMTTLDSKQQGMSVATAQIPQQQNHFAQALSQSASTTSTPVATTAPVSQPTAPGSRGAAFFGGVFHRGFFSKPVERSDEENYRYLMALDR